MKTLANPFWGAMELGVREGAEAAGVEYYLQAVESDQAAEPQLNVCNTMLERQPDAMITAAINSTILLPCLKRATKWASRSSTLTAPRPRDCRRCRSRDRLLDRVGQRRRRRPRPEWLVGQLGAEASGPVLVIEGLSGNITGQKRARGFAEKLAELAPGLEIVASLPGDWDRGKAPTSQ